MPVSANQKIADLIDDDNAQAAVIQELLNEVLRYCTSTIKRAYGSHIRKVLVLKAPLRIGVSDQTSLIFQSHVGN